MARRFDHVADVEAFVAVAEQGSFTAGAVSLASTASVLSRAVGRLEARLGQQLLHRTTRRLSLTDTGRLYLEQVRAAFTLLDDAERDAQGDAEALTGCVRISVPTSFGHYRLPALLQPFTAQYPQVRIEVNITNRNVDLAAEGFDLVIRLGPLPDSGLVARKLEDAPLCLVAAPAYLQQMGVPRTLDDLPQHRCLPFVMPRTGRLAPWVFRAQGEDVEWLPEAAVTVSDDVLGWFHWQSRAWASARAMTSLCTVASRTAVWRKCCPSCAGAAGRFRWLRAAPPGKPLRGR
jgi:DNA-binding transcriptional LysR family regulator